MHCSIYHSNGDRCGSKYPLQTDGPLWEMKTPVPYSFEWEDHTRPPKVHPNATACKTHPVDLWICICMSALTHMPKNIHTHMLLYSFWYANTRQKGFRNMFPDFFFYFFTFLTATYACFHLRLFTPGMIFMAWLKSTLTRVKGSAILLVCSQLMLSLLLKPVFPIFCLYAFRCKTIYYYLLRGSIGYIGRMLDSFII